VGYGLIKHEGLGTHATTQGLGGVLKMIGTTDAAMNLKAAKLPASTNSDTVARRPRPLADGEGVHMPQGLPTSLMAEIQSRKGTAGGVSYLSSSPI
jgi:hypothetical protein